MKRSASVTAAAVLAVAAACAAAQQVVKLEPRTQDGITYLTGGVGIDEREAMVRQAGEYNLRLTFVTETRGAYLGVVSVGIQDSAGRTLLSTLSDGPWFYAKLAAGSYTISAESRGQEHSQKVEISAARPAIVLFRWSPGNR